jgi:hypothetical protein
VTENNSAPRIAPDIVWRLLDDNAVVVSPRVGEVRVLNSVGTAIWQRLVEEEELAGIEEYLQNSYDVKAERVHSDLLSFLTCLGRNGFMTLPPLLQPLRQGVL